MNLNSILTFLAVLTLSSNVFAIEVQEKLKITANNQIAPIHEISPDTHLATHIVNSHTIPQASAEKPSEFTQHSAYFQSSFIQFTA